MKRLIVFLAALYLATAQWKDSILIKANATGVMGVYGDSTTGVVHILFHDRKGIYYTNLAADLVVGKIYTFPGMVPMISQGSITGNAKDVFATFVANSTTDSKYDIYFSESKDGGESWSAPTQVPRKDMKDKVNRLAPCLLRIPSTDRLWIFYHCWNYVCYVTRSPGSYIFTDEVKLSSYAADSSMSQLEAAITLESGRTIIHLAWKNLIRKALYYSRTENNGVTWLEPRYIAELPGTGFSPIRDYALTSMPKQNPVELYLSYYDQKTKRVIMKTSKNHGVKWSLPTLIQDSVFILKYPIFTRCESKPNELISFLYPEDEVPCEYGVYKISAEKYTSRIIPTKEAAVSLASMDCMDISGKGSYVYLLALLEKNLVILRTTFDS